MSTIIFGGNTYTFGATVSANPGTGTTSYVFGGLSSGWTYGFIIWAFNGVGPSSIVGPITKVTLSESIEEIRPTIFSGALINPYGNIFDAPTQSRGSGINLFSESEDIRSTSFSGNCAWLWSNAISSAKTGFTAPDGSTTAIEIVTFSGSASSLRINTNVMGDFYLEGGYTYYFSFYHDIQGGTGLSTPSMYYYLKSDNTPTDPIFWTQILPVTGPASYGAITMKYPIGASLDRWQRFAFSMYQGKTTYVNQIGELLIIANQWIGVPAGKTAYIWGLQLEKGST